MNFVEGSFYHIYNRGNDKQTIFIQERNYSYFLDKVKQFIIPNANLIAWCLMPNHFHFLVQATTQSVKMIKEKPVPINALTENIRIMLSSYTRAIQKQESLTGSLFQQKTKCKCADNYLTQTFHYIHQNPLRAGLVEKLEDYTWSSFGEYMKVSKETICQTDIAFHFLNFEKDRLIADSYGVIPDHILQVIV
jgi:putative transposase